MKGDLGGRCENVGGEVWLFGKCSVSWGYEAKAAARPRQEEEAKAIGSKKNQYVMKIFAQRDVEAIESSAERTQVREETGQGGHHQAERGPGDETTVPEGRQMNGSSKTGMFFKQLLARSAALKEVGRD